MIIVGENNHTMNHQDHIRNSVEIFGGQEKDYEDIHRTIDMNKLATASVYGRFFLHHVDIGGAILEKIFGKSFKSSEGKEVATVDILKQHLIEDYEDLPKFADWKEQFKSLGFFLKVKVRDNDAIKKAVSNDEILSELRIKDIDLLLSVLDLTLFTEKEISGYDKYLIFGHALGIHLAEKIVGPPVGTTKIATVDAFRNLLLLKFGQIFTLVDYEQHITQKEWMEAPKNIFRKSAKSTEKMLTAGYAFERIQKVRDADEKERNKRRDEAIKRAPAYRPRHRGCSGKGVMD